MLLRIMTYLAALLVCTPAHAAFRSDCLGDEGGAKTVLGSVLQKAIDDATNGKVVLCRQAKFLVYGSIRIPSNRTIETMGRPTNDSAKATILYKNGSGLSQGQAVLNANGRSNVIIRNIIVDGGRTSAGIERITGNNGTRWRALIAISGKNSALEYVRAVNTVGGYTIAAADDRNCENLRIVHSYIGNAGFSEQDQWADGLGLYCSGAYIAHNQFRDVTDGAITFYCGNDTIIENNWIANSGRSGISGIIAAAAQKRTIGSGFPNFHGSVARDNLIETSNGRRLVIGIAAGTRMWCDIASNNPDCDRIAGMSFRNNSGSGLFGYGIVVAGMSSATISGNDFDVTLWTNSSWQGGMARCRGSNYYVVESGSGGTLQSGYASRGNLTGCAWP
jgi:hypothetical protein